MDKRKTLEKLDEQFTREQQRIEELFKALDQKKKQDRKALEAMYERFNYAIHKLNPQFNEMNKFTKELEILQESFEQDIIRGELRINNQLEDSKRKYQKKKQQIIDQMEKK